MTNQQSPVDLSDAGVGVPYRALFFSNKPLRRPVFHYTDRQGFVGIVEKGQLWASDINHSNDIAELRYGFALMDRGLQTIADSGIQPVSDRVKSVMQFLNEGSFFSPVYAVCFSTQGDSLSQWRGYARGGGFAIGLTPTSLQQIVAAFPGTSLVRVVYKPKDHEKLAEMLLRELVDLLGRIPDADWSNRAAMIVARRFGISATLLSARMKHPAFREEDEWRLLVAPAVGTPIKFRAARTSIVPYVQLPLNPTGKGLKGGTFVVGPTAMPDEALVVARRVVYAHTPQAGWPIPGRFKKSTIPYRDW